MKSLSPVLTLFILSIIFLTGCASQKLTPAAVPSTQDVTSYPRIISMDYIMKYNLYFFRVADDSAAADLVTGTFTKGDTIQISWMQPMALKPYAEQNDPANTLPATDSVLVELFTSDLNHEVINNDTTSVWQRQEIELLPGVYGVSLRSFRNNECYSKLSDWVYIRIGDLDTPPMRPIRLEIIVR